MKKLFALGAAAVLAMGLASCDQGGPSGEGKTIKLEYSGTGSNKEFNMELFEDFKAARKAAGDTNTYEITYVEHGPDKIDSEIVDWSSGPDVYEFASDKITGLYEKGALAKVSGEFATFVKNSNSQLGVDLATFNGSLYGYPYTGDNTYYLQYDKSRLSADDVKSMETLLDKANSLGLKVGYNLKIAFWGGAAMFTFGADYSMTFDEDGSVKTITADFDSDKGLKAAKAIYNIIKHPAWQDAMEAPTETNGLVACIAGTWDIAAYKKALGENYACAPMPTVTVDGDTKNLGAFLGGKLLGVNPQRGGSDVDRVVAAHQLSQFLSNKECQLKRFDDQGVAPCNKEAAATDRVVNDPNVKVLIEQAVFAHAQTAVPSKFWDAPTAFIAGIVDGTTTLDNLSAAVKNFNDLTVGATN